MKTENSADLGITCLIPNKNGSAFISELERHFNESKFNPLEILVIDDGSTDASIILLKDWAKRDSRVRVITNPGAGLVQALNFGILNSKHSWIARYDMDDQYHRERIPLQVDAIEPGVVLVFSDYELTDSDGVSFGTIAGPIHNDQVFLSLFANRRTPHSSAFFMKSAAIEAGMYLEGDYLAEDQSLWIRMSNLGRLVSVPLPLLKYRVSANSLLSANRIRSIKTRNRIRRERDFLPAARSALKNIGSVKSSYSSFEDAHARFVLHIFEIGEVFFSHRQYLDLMKLVLASLRKLNFYHYKAIVTGLKVRKIKNRIQELGYSQTDSV
jgi:glycosyltransferase involved in cell wall biosynthesis